MADDSIFSKEILNALTVSKENSNKGPVTVLGKTFANDDERRAYFREELRKKLPELKKIEGFPIGEDDDIINLSDPPYYTACPNPWLNEIIGEWELEKQRIEKNGERDSNKKVVAPYSYGIKQGKNSAIYNAHTYHTKVPHEVIMRYILHYTQPGDIILDGFAGTGMTGVAATACSHPSDEIKLEIESDFKDNGFSEPHWGVRHAVCGDLSPLCFHISSNYNSRVDTTSLRKDISEILADLEDNYGYLYKIEIPNGIRNKIVGHVNYYIWSEIALCHNCNHELNIHDLSYDYGSKTLNEMITCPYCGTRQTKKETKTIFETTYDEINSRITTQVKYECCLLNYSIPPKNSRYFSRDILPQRLPEYVGFIPNLRVPDIGDEITRLHRLGCDYICDIYHKRTQYVLSYLYKLIQEKYSNNRKPLMFIFSSMLPKLTRMNRYMPQHGSRALVGPMANTLYIPPQNVENNPIDQFEFQAKKVLKALDECNSGAAIQICSATHTSLADNSIDYIFADPPFGANIMYSELNTVSESWLKVMTNNHEEAISNRSQHKGLPEYQAIMTECFKEYNRVLKPGKWMTVEFSNTSAAFWNSLQYSIKSAGFVISAITDLNKERGGLHAMLGPTAVKQDLAISCYKPSEELNERVNNNSLDSLWEMVSEHLSHVAKFIKKENSVIYITERDPRIIYDRVISFYVQKGLPIPIDSLEFRKELPEHFVCRDGMYFSPIDAAEYEQQKKDSLGFQTLALIITSEQEGIHWLRTELGKKPQTRQDLHPKWMAALGGGRKGDIIPDLSQILEENFIQNNDKTWRCPNMQDDQDVNAIRTKALLREFKIYVEQASKPKAKIKEVRVEAVRAGFKDCYIRKDFQTIVMVGDKIPQNLLTEDEILLQFYDIAVNHV